MASLCACVIRGIKTPFVVDFTSNRDLVSGDIVPIPAEPVLGKVFCALSAYASTRVVVRKNRLFFIKFNFYLE